MKKVVTLVLASFFVIVSCKQDVKTSEVVTKVEAATKTIKEAVAVQTISLEQIPGEFKQKELVLEAGTYVFEIANNNVDHEVGFVLAPKGKTDAANHIKSAYVKAPVALGNTSLTNEVVLTKGEYVYFCPLNPTPEYTLIVK